MRLAENSPPAAQKVVTFELPRPLATWPFARRLNPHYEEVKAASDAWLADIKAFTSAAQIRHNVSNFCLLTSLGTPFSSSPQLRVVCDLMHLFFLFDEYSDQADSTQARKMVSCIMDTMRQKHEHHGKCKLSEATAGFRERLAAETSKKFQEDFIVIFENYANSVVRQAGDRDRAYRRTISEYFDNRRQNIGAYPCFALLQMGIDLPRDAAQHPKMKELEVCAVDLILLGNDAYSYNVEQATGGDDHNIVTILMERESLSLSEAMLWVEDRCKHIITQFLSARDALPSFGKDEDQAVAQYVWGVEMWVTGNDCWSFESGRYFGTRGKEIQEHRIVELLPKTTRVPVQATL